jgi:hypothetical protein
MAQEQVRAAFRAKLEADFPPEQYVETIAEEPDEAVLPDLWMTVDFASEGERRTSIGTPSLWQEDARAYISVAGVSGEGDAVVIARADAVASAFRNWQYPAQGLIVNAVSVQSQPAADSEGKWWFTAVMVDYQRTFYA